MSGQGETRIGVLVPAGNVVHQREFARLSPTGIAFSFVDFSYPNLESPSFCDEVLTRMALASRELARWGADAILVGCTTASMACFASGLGDRLQSALGIPVVTAADAARQAIAACGVRSIAVATPYGPLSNRIVSDFLIRNGLEVAAVEGLGLDGSPTTWMTVPSLSSTTVFELACRADRKTADAIYLPCTAMASLEAIERFERHVGKFAFSSVQAGYWAVLRRLGHNKPQVGAGSLLDARGPRNTM